MLILGSYEEFKKKKSSPLSDLDFRSDIEKKERKEVKESDEPDAHELFQAPHFMY
jgi:hypothetical protein